MFRRELVAMVRWWRVLAASNQVPNAVFLISPLSILLQEFAQMQCLLQASITTC